MVLNSTNKTRIAKQHWNDKVADGTACEGRINLLKNIAVRLTKEEARDVQFGGTTWGLRISRLAPASEDEMRKWMSENGYAQPVQPQKKEITADKVAVTVEWAKKNGKTIDDIAKMYNMSEDIRKQISDSLAPSDDMPGEE